MSSNVDNFLFLVRERALRLNSTMEQVLQELADNPKLVRELFGEDDTLNVKDLCDTPEGFSDTKGDDNYWLDAVRKFWAETGMDTDSMELMWILNWFDKKRKQLNAH